MESSRETTVLFALLIGGEELYARAGDKKAHDAIEHCQFRLGRAAASCGGRLGWIALGQPRAEAKGNRRILLRPRARAAAATQIKGVRTLFQ